MAGGEGLEDERSGQEGVFALNYPAVISASSSDCAGKRARGLSSSRGFSRLNYRLLLSFLEEFLSRRVGRRDNKYGIRVNIFRRSLLEHSQVSA